MAKARLAVLLGILAVLLVAFGTALAQITGRPGLALALTMVVPLSVFGGLAVYALAIGAAVLVHEFGHYLAGRTVGFRLRLFVVGPFGLRMENGRLVRYRARPVRLLGYVSMVPDDDHDLLRRFARFILGGPVASLVWTGLVFAVWRASDVPTLLDLPRRAPVGTTVAAMVASVVLLGTFVVLPGTLLPYRVRRMAGFPTDAMWLLILRRGGDEARRLVALLTLTRLLLAGTKAKDLPGNLVEEAARCRDGSLAELNALTMRWAHLGERDPAGAQAAIERHAEVVETLGDRLAEPARTWARVVQAMQATLVRKDGVAGAAWLEGTVEPPEPLAVASRRLTFAALAALRDDPDRAPKIEEAAAAVETAAARSTVDWEWERRWIERLRAGWPREDRPGAPPAIRST